MATPSRHAAPVLEFCARVVLVQKPRYREPRWSTLLPPEVHEFRSPAMRSAIAESARLRLRAAAGGIHAAAPYGGDVLVEHDVTFDLFGQIARRERTLAAWWDWFRWRRFETRAVRRYRRVVVMSPKDAEMLGPRVPATVIENGVDLARFQPEPETPGQRLLFIGSFRHFPNVEAYRFFTERVWPLLRDKFPRARADRGLRPRSPHLLARLRRFARARPGPASSKTLLRDRDDGPDAWFHRDRFGQRSGAQIDPSQLGQPQATGGGPGGPDRAERRKVVSRPNSKA